MTWEDVRCLVFLWCLSRFDRLGAMTFLCVPCVFCIVQSDRKYDFSFGLACRPSGKNDLWLWVLIVLFGSLFFFCWRGILILAGGIRVAETSFLVMLP